MLLAVYTVYFQESQLIFLAVLLTTFFLLHCLDENYFDSGFVFVLT